MMNLITDGPKIVDKVLTELRVINGNLMAIHGELQTLNEYLHEIVIERDHA